MLFLAGAVPLILVRLRRGRGQFDEEVFHLPTIRRFAAQLDRGWPDVSDYLSATTPGYHLLMAAVSRWLGDSLFLLKFVNAALTAAVIALLAEAVRRRASRAAGVSALALLAPFIGSMYVFVPGVWLQPDNVGWLGVLIIMLLALRQRWDSWSLVAGGLVLLLLVWVRQSHVWAAGVLWVGAWIGGAQPVPGTPTSLARSLGTNVRWFAVPTSGRIARVALVFGASVPALASLAWFANLWHGLTPPSFRQQHGGGANPATPAFAMALFAIYSLFFGAWIWPGLRRLWSERRAGGWLILLPSILIGLLAAAIPNTTFVYEARATGLWNLVRALESRGLTIHDHTSPLILVLAPMGLVALCAWLVQLPRRRAWVYGLSLLGFVAAQTANTNAWQRYIEPMFLMTLALMAADLAAHPTIPLPSAPLRRRARWAGPALLGLLGVLLTAFTLWREPVFVKDWPDHPLAQP